MTYVPPWLVHNSRVKHVYVDRTHYICLDGKFHSWAVDIGETDWVIRTVKKPWGIWRMPDTSIWMNSISQ